MATTSEREVALLARNAELQQALRYALNQLASIQSDTDTALEVLGEFTGDHDSGC